MTDDDCPDFDLPAPAPTKVLPPRRKPQPAAVPSYAAARVPGRLVASFACMCGCQDEVREPAPDLIPCWGDKCRLKMYRWRPPIAPPIHNARVWDGKARAK